MLFDLRNKLEAIGKLSLLDPANEKVRRYYEAVASEDENVASLYRRSAALIQHGDDLVAKGDTEGAIEFYQAARTICEHRANQQTDNTSWRRELAAIHARLAGVARVQNDLTAAMSEETTGLSILQDLARTNPERAELQHEIGLALKNRVLPSSKRPNRRSRNRIPKRDISSRSNCNKGCAF